MKSPERPIGSPEQFDEAEWEKLKRKKGPAFALNRGKALGVPRDELNKFAEKVIEQGIKDNEFAFVYRFMTNMGIGTKDTARDIGKRAYDFFMTIHEYGSAAGMAKNLYGKDSDEWRRANEAVEVEFKKSKKRKTEQEETKESGEWNVFAQLSHDSTFADLFHVMEAHPEREELEEQFGLELHDNFGQEIVNEVLSFIDTNKNKASTTKVIGFFKEHGYSQSDITAFLPITFKK